MAARLLNVRCGEQENDPSTDLYLGITFISKGYHETQIRAYLAACCIRPSMLHWTTGLVFSGADLSPH